MTRDKFDILTDESLTWTIIIYQCQDLLALIIIVYTGLKK